MVDHISESQLECKSWLLQHLNPGEDGVVIGGWYGLLANTLGYLSIDLDPRCSHYGQILYPDAKFSTDDGFNYLMRNEPDTVICTSCEHIPQEDLDTLNYLPEGTQLVLQSNDWESVGGHINCKSSLEEFVSEYNVNVEYSGEMDMGEYKRWMLIGSL